MPTGPIFETISKRDSGGVDGVLMPFADALGTIRGKVRSIENSAFGEGSELVVEAVKSEIDGIIASETHTAIVESRTRAQRL